MKRIILVCLLCITFSLSATLTSLAASVDDYPVIVNSLTLGEKTENLPNFVKVQPNNNESYTRFSGKYNDITISGMIRDGCVSNFEIRPPYDLDTKMIEEIAAILKNKYGNPIYSEEDVYCWGKNPMYIYLVRLRTEATKPGEGGPGTIIGVKQ